MRSRQLLFVLGIVLVLLILGAAIFMLFLSARMQQGLFSREPAYSAEELYQKGVAQLDGGDPKAAEQYLEQALLKEDDATFRNQLAVVKYRLKKYPEAIDQYKKLIAAGKDAAFAWNGIGNAYRDWGAQEEGKRSEYWGEAEKAYKETIRINKQYVAAYSNLAFLYQEMGRKTDALAILDQGIAATTGDELKQIRKTISGQ